MPSLGVDPGLTGALAWYDKDMDSLLVIDMPTVKVRDRSRIDVGQLQALMGHMSWRGCDRCVLELVGGRPQQAAGAGFQFGVTWGIVYALAATLNMPIETVSPQMWKHRLKVPGKTTGGNEAIGLRANELLPNHQHVWRGPRGGLNLDRAEAAMLAYYGEHYAE